MECKSILQIKQLSWTCQVPDIPLLGPNPTCKFTPTTSMTFPNFQQFPAKPTSNFQCIQFCVQPDALCKVLCTNPLCPTTTIQKYLAEQIPFFYPRTSPDGITQSPSRAVQCPEPPTTPHFLSQKELDSNNSQSFANDIFFLFPFGFHICTLLES